MPTLNQALTGFLTAKPRSEASRRNYRQTLGALFEALGGGENDAGGVTRSDLVNWHNDLRERDLSPWTVASRARDAKAFFRWLADEGYIECSPAEGLKVQQYKPRRLELLSISTNNLARILAAARRSGVRDYALIRFLADTGCRRAGVCSVRLDRLDLEARYATVRNKGELCYDVRLSTRLVAALRAYLAVRPEVDTPYVFLTRRPPYRPLQPSGVSTIWRRLAEGAGVKGRHNMHAARHRFAAQLARSGANMAYIQEALGHEDMATTRLYVRVSPDRLAELVEGVSLPD